jgi:hypothetical protein
MKLQAMTWQQATTLLQSMTLATSNGMAASSKVKPTDNKGTNVDEMDISPTITTHPEGRYFMHNTISTVQERGPYTVLHTFIYQI